MVSLGQGRGGTSGGTRDTVQCNHTHAYEVIGCDLLVIKDRQEEDSSVDCHVFVLDWAV